MAVKQSAWDMAQKIVDDLPPYLEDDELTVDRLYERNKDKMSNSEARLLLEALVEEGKLERQPRRRRGQGGSNILVYVTATVAEKGK